MPKAVKIKEGVEYLPEHDSADLERMRDVLPAGKPRLRVQAAILRKKGMSIEKTGPAPGENPSTIHNRLLRLAEGGLCRIYDRPGTGRPCKLADDELLRPELLICNGPQACGYARDNWTAGLLAHQIMNCFGEKYSASGLLDLVSRMGYSVRKPQPAPYNSASPEEQAEFREATKRDQMEHRKRGYKVLCFDACAKTDSPAARRGIRTRGGSDTVSTNHSKKSIQMLGMLGEGTLDHLMFSKTYNSGDTLRMIRHVHKKYEKIYCLMDNAGSNTAADVLKYAAGSGGGVVPGHTLPHTPQLNPIEPQWAAIRGSVGGTYFGDFGSMQICIKKALENGEIPVVRLQECLTDPTSPRGGAGIKVIRTA